MISWEDFDKIDIRCGTIIEAQEFPKAKKPAYKLRIDFRSAGIRNSSAQITALYSLPDLINRQVIAIINFPPKQVANFISECLVLGVYNREGHVVLLQPGAKVPDGSGIK